MKPILHFISWNNDLPYFKNLTDEKPLIARAPTFNFLLINAGRAKLLDKSKVLLLLVHIMYPNNFSLEKYLNFPAIFKRVSRGLTY